MLMIFITLSLKGMYILGLILYAISDIAQEIYNNHIKEKEKI